MAKKDINKDKKKNNFFKELKSELKKVTWPTFKKLVNNTSAVIAVVLIVSIIVFILDVCFENLNDFGVGKIKSLVSSNIENTEETTDAEETNDLGDGIELSPDEENQEEDSETDQNAEETNADSQEQTDNSSEEEVAQ